MFGSTAVVHEEVVVELCSGDGLEGGAGDELQRVLRCGAAHLVASLLHQAHKFGTLVGGDTTGDSDDDFHVQ